MSLRTDQPNTRTNNSETVRERNTRFDPRLVARLPSSSGDGDAFDGARIAGL